MRVLAFHFAVPLQSTTTLAIKGFLAAPSSPRNAPITVQRRAGWTACLFCLSDVPHLGPSCLAVLFLKLHQDRAPREQRQGLLDLRQPGFQLSFVPPRAGPLYHEGQGLLRKQPKTFFID